MMYPIFRIIIYKLLLVLFVLIRIRVVPWMKPWIKASFYKQTLYPYKKLQIKILNPVFHQNRSIQKKISSQDQHNFKHKLYTKVKVPTLKAANPSAFQAIRQVNAVARLIADCRAALLLAPNLLPTKRNIVFL